MKNTLLLVILSLFFCVSVSAQREIFVSVPNESSTERQKEVVVLDWQEVLKLNSNLKPDYFKVSENGAPVASQTIDTNADGTPEKLVLQVNFKADEKSKSVKIEETGDEQPKNFISFFPLANYWWFYAGFLVFVLFMLALDLGVFNRKAHAVTFREATIWSIVWVVLAMIFNGFFYYYSSQKFDADIGTKFALEFLTGYVLEYSLSVDNIFVFVLVFNYFRIPAEYKHRVLFYGILGALIFRAVFIALGSALMQFNWIIYIFGAFLIITGIKMLFSNDEEIEPEKNLLIRGFRKLMPVTTDIKGKDFFVVKDGIKHATPLFIALLFLEATDIIFAVDSVPAIFGVTKEPLIVFTSNIFAILGLRSMYFMLAGIISKFYLLKYGLAVVLVFVGLKMVWLNPWYGGHFPITWSLGFILTTIALSIVASLIFPPDEAVAEIEAQEAEDSKRAEKED